MTHIVLAAFALCLAAILGVSLMAKWRGRLTGRGKAVARNTLVIAILALAIAFVYFGFWNPRHTHVLRAPRWLLKH